MAKIELKARRRLLPFDSWPDADREAWAAACRPAARLKPGGRAGHLRQVTRDCHADDYSYFLGFLHRSSLLERNQLPAANITPEKIAAYIDDLNGHIAPTTLYSSICRIRRIAKYMVPDRDFTWLAEIDKELALVAHPRSKSGRFVLAEVLVEAGLTLMLDAEGSSRLTELSRACQMRNGLMVALLALCPIRLKNFTALEIGRSFVQIKNRWWIVLLASETKEKRADERPVPELLTSAIDCYLSQYRPVLARSDPQSQRLWLSANDGTPITGKEVARVIRMTTLSTVGIAQGPHMFRTSAVSAAGVYAGNNPNLGSAILHHTHPSLTIEHYNRATSLSASESFRQIIRQYDKT